MECNFIYRENGSLDGCKLKGGAWGGTVCDGEECIFQKILKLERLVDENKTLIKSRDYYHDRYVEALDEQGRDPKNKK